MSNLLTEATIMSLSYRELQSAYREFCEVHKVYQPPLNRKKDILQRELIALVKEIDAVVVNDYGQAFKKADAITVDDTVVNRGTVDYVDVDESDDNYIVLSYQDGSHSKHKRDISLPILSEQQLENRCEFLVEVQRRHYREHFSDIAIYQACLARNIGTFAYSSSVWRFDIPTCIERLVQYDLSTYTYSSINNGVYVALNNEAQIVPYFGSQENKAHRSLNLPDASSICLFSEGIAIHRSHQTREWLDFRIYEFIECHTVRLSYEFEPGKPIEFDCIESTYKLDVPAPIGNLVIKLATFHHGTLNLDYKRVTVKRDDGSVSLLSHTIATDKSISAVEMRSQGVSQALKHMKLSNV